MRKTNFCIFFFFFNVITFTQNQKLYILSKKFLFFFSLFSSLKTVNDVLFSSLFVKFICYHCHYLNFSLFAYLISKASHYSQYKQLLYTILVSVVHQLRDISSIQCLLSCFFILKKFFQQKKVAAQLLNDLRSKQKSVK